jgi:hypothetical protein
LHDAPVMAFRKRLDEVKAAKHPKLRWYKLDEESNN